MKDITKFRPIIVSKTLHSSFMVDDDNYSKMITLTGSETLVLFFGRTDKTDRSYLRIEGDQKVYEVNFVLDNLVIEPELWLELKPQKTFMIWNHNEFKLYYYAEKRIRTSTKFPSLAPEASASTNSAIPALF